MVSTFFLSKGAVADHSLQQPPIRLLNYRSGDGVPLQVNGEDVPVQAQGHREGPLRAVEEDDRQGTVRIPEGGYLQPVGEVGGGDALGAGPDVPAEMADIVVGELDLHFAGAGVPNEGGLAVVPHVIGPPLLVEDNIPVQKAVHARAEVAQHIVGVHLGVGQLVPAEAAILNTPLGEEQLFPGELLTHQAQGVEVVAAVPVEGQAGHHVVGAAIDLGAGPVEEPLLIVVPDVHVHIPQARPAQPGVEVFRQKRPLLFRRVEAAVPGLGGVGLVLHAEGGDVNPPVPVLPDVTAQIPGPEGVALFFQVPSPVSAAVGLHKGGWRPGGEHDGEILPRRVTGRTDPGEDPPLVPCQGEGAQAFIPRVGDGGVLASGKVTAVDMGTDGPVAQPPGSEAGVDDLPGLLRRHPLQNGAHRVGDGAAEEGDLLVSHLRVEVHQPQLPSPRVRAEGDGLLPGDCLRAVKGGGVDGGSHAQPPLPPPARTMLLTDLGSSGK